MIISVTHITTSVTQLCLENVYRQTSCRNVQTNICDGCKREYPKVIAQLREDFLAPNTQSGEQTFVWFGKFQKILNNMPKTRHHFMVTGSGAVVYTVYTQNNSCDTMTLSYL